MIPAPAVVLPVPALRKVRYRELGDGWLQMELLRGRSEMKDDLCDFELQDVDLNSWADCADFAKESEVEVVPLPGRSRWSDLMYESFFVREESYEEGFDAEDDYTYTVCTVADRLGFDLRPNEVVGSLEELRLHVAEVAVRLWMLRIIAGAVRGDVSLVVGEHAPNDGVLSPLLPFEIYPSIPQAAHAKTVEGWCQRFLSPFTPRIDFGGGLVGENATVFDVATLQLRNHLVSGSGWRMCERCGRPFVQQRGRAKPDGSGWHRSDSKYCQKKCAQAAASANWRKKQRSRGEG